MGEEHSRRSLVGGDGAVGHGSHQALRFGGLGVGEIFLAADDGQRGENADHCHDHHELYEGETSAQHASISGRPRTDITWGRLQVCFH